MLLPCRADQPWRPSEVAIESGFVLVLGAAVNRRVLAHVFRRLA